MIDVFDHSNYIFCFYFKPVTIDSLCNVKESQFNSFSKSFQNFNKRICLTARLLIFVDTNLVTFVTSHSSIFSIVSVWLAVRTQINYLCIVLTWNGMPDHHSNDAFKLINDNNFVRIVQLFTVLFSLFFILCVRIAYSFHHYYIRTKINQCEKCVRLSEKKFLFRLKNF